MTEDQSSSAKLASLPPGYDEEDPYEGVDLESYPEWWRENIAEFKRYNMRPYRPPQFSDGEIVPEIVRELNERLDVTITIQKVNPHEKRATQSDEKIDWDILVDGESIATAPRYRATEGYTVYDISSREFKQQIEDAV